MVDSTHTIPQPSAKQKQQLQEFWKKIEFNHEKENIGRKCERKFLNKHTGDVFLKYWVTEQKLIGNLIQNLRKFFKGLLTQIRNLSIHKVFHHFSSK